MSPVFESQDSHGRNVEKFWTDKVLEEGQAWGETMNLDLMEKNGERTLPQHTVSAALESWPRAWHGMTLPATAPLPTIFYIFQLG